MRVHASFVTVQREEKRPRWRRGGGGGRELLEMISVMTMSSHTHNNINVIHTTFILHL